MKITTLNRCLYYKILFKLLKKNIVIGKGVKFYTRVLIQGPGYIKIGDNCCFYGFPGDKKQFVTLYTLLPSSKIIIGKGSKFFASRFSAKYLITIGEEVYMEDSGIADTDFHSLEITRKEPEDENLERCQVLIGNRVAIGSRSFITKGVTVGDDAMIGPGSIVNRSVPPGAFVLGNPARVVYYDEE